MKLDFPALGGGGGRSRAKAWKRFDFFGQPTQTRALDDASRTIRIGVVTAAVFFGLLALFSFVVPISGAAVASGEVTTSGTRIVVQPIASGLVSELLVREGDYVRAGQPLVRLNGVRSAAKAQQAQAKRDALRALQARLTAERDGLDRLTFPTDLTQRSFDPAVASAVRAQTAIFERRRSILAAERRIADTQRATAEAQRTGAAEQLRLIEDELSGVRSLYDRGFATIGRVRALERAAAELRSQSSSGSSAVARSELEAAKLAETQTMDVVAQLARVEEQLAQVDPALRVSRFDAERDTLRAPVSGRVSGVARIGPGTVLGAGSTVLEIVPEGRSLIIEALIQPSDIDDVAVGSAATLRFTSVNPRGQSSFDGKVVALSPARVVGQDGTGAFRAQIMVDDPSALARNNVELRPGIPVVVHIKTHSRTLFNYLFAPVEDAMSGAFREE